MARYQVILSYDGTHFQGFQRLAPVEGAGQRSVQGVVEKALRELRWQGRAILAAGRTDAGVHADGQVIAFDLEWSRPLQILANALNARFPDDVAALAVNPARPDFHPRFDARARRYVYRLYCSENRHPLRDRYAWRVFPPVDEDRLAEATSLVLGTHDFRRFGSAPRKGGTTIRNVFKASWERDDAFLVFEIVANAYLLHMVRRIVVTLVKIGQGWLELDELARSLFLTGDGRPEMEVMMQGLAPPQGLSLAEVYYDARWGQERNEKDNL